MARPHKVWFRKQKNYWCVKIGGKLKILAHGKENKKEAEQKFHELMAGMAQAPESRAARTADVIEAFLRYSHVHCAKDTYRLHRFYCQAFAEACGQIPVADLKLFHVSRWVDKNVEAGIWHETTVYNARRTAFRVLSWAAKEGLTGRNPLAGMPRPMPAPRNRAITDEEFWRLYENAGDPLRDLLLALFLTGARPKEVRELTWDQVQEDRWVIEKHKSRKKTGQPRIIYLPEQIRDMMVRRRSETGGRGHVFHNTLGEPWTLNAMRLQIYRIRTKLGMSQDVCAYLCRHGFGTRAIVSGVDGKTLAELMGHTSTEMINRVYVHLADQRRHLNDAVEKVNSHVPTPSEVAPRPARKRAMPVRKENEDTEV
jgi:integrase